MLYEQVVMGTYPEQHVMGRLLTSPPWACICNVLTLTAPLTENFHL